MWGAGLLALLLAQWSLFLFTDRTFYFRDLSFFSMPLLVETSRQWAAGVFPAWNPHLASGAPLAADPNAQAFFPDQLVLVLLGAGLPAVKAVLLLRLFLVPLLAYAALRIIPFSPSAAFLGAALVSLSGPVASTLSSFNAHLAGAIVFLPLAAAGFRLRLGGARVVVAAALLTGLALVAGSPELALQGAIVFLLCAVGRKPGEVVGRCATAVAAGALLAAVLWLPAAALYPRTPRGLGWKLATPPGFLSFPPGRILELVWPGFLGDPTAEAPDAYWGRGMTDGVTPYLLSVAVGLLPWILMPATLRHPFGRRLAAAGSLFALLSFGKFLPAGDWLLRAPVLGALRYPEKWWIGASLAFAASAAAGLEQLRNADARTRRHVFAAAGVILLLSLGLCLVTSVAPGLPIRGLRGIGLIDPELGHTADGNVAAALRRTGLESGLVSLAVILLLAWAHRRRLEARVAPLLAAIVLCERLPHALTAVPAVPMDALRREGADVVAARTEAGEGRFFYDREATTSLDPLRPFTGTLYGLSYAGNTDVDQFSDARSRAFATAVQGLPFSDDRKLGLLRLAGVRVVDTDDPSAGERPELALIGDSREGRRLYRLGEASAGRMYFRAVRVDGPPEAMKHLLARGLPLGSVAILEGANGFEAPVARHSLGRLTLDAPNAFRIRVETEGAGLLQLPITFDPHWRVRVDGKETRGLCVDATFLGVPLEAGTHEVTGQYRDPWFLAGATVTVSTLVLLGLAWGRNAAGRRAGRDAPPAS